LEFSEVVVRVLRVLLALLLQVSDRFFLCIEWFFS
jgi:hypothetical protein